MFIPNRLSIRDQVIEIVRTLLDKYCDTYMECGNLAGICDNPNVDAADLYKCRELCEKTVDLMGGTICNTLYSMPVEDAIIALKGYI